MIEQSSSGNQLKLMKYLDELNKQMSSRKSSGVLQQHLSSLSKAYDQAQQKLLQTQKALMIQSVLLEKQRSVIGYYKDVLNEEMDEDGILYFLQQLEEDESNRQIYDDIVDLRNIVNRKKVKNCKRQYEDQKSIKQLKKQVARLHQQYQDVYDENQKANTTLNGVAQNNTKLSEELEDYKQKMANILQRAKLFEEENCRLKRDNEVFELQVKRFRNLTIQMNAKDTQLKELKKWKEQFESFLKDKLHLQTDNQENINKNSNKLKQNNMSQAQKSRQAFFTIEKKLNQLLKYKSQYKKMKDNFEQFQFLKRQVSLLKLFISQQAFELFKQFELQKMDCIETEIRNLAVLQRGRHIKLEECQKEVWKYKIQLLRQQDLCALQNSSHTMPSYSRNKLNSSKCSNLIQTFRATQQPLAKTALNLSIADKISQFQS